MASTNSYTLSRLLSGLVNLNTAYIGAVFSTDSSNPDNISQLSNISYVSNPIPADVVYDGSYIALTAAYAFFPNVQTNYQNQYINFYTYTIIGSLSAIIGFDSVYSGVPTIGSIYYLYPSNRIIYFDFPSSYYIELFNSFETNVLTGGYGNLQNKNIKLAILDPNYTPDLVNQTLYSDLASGVLERSNAAPCYINNTGQLCCSATFSFNNFPNGDIAQQMVVYIDNFDSSFQYLIGYFTSNALTNIPLTGDGNTNIYFNFNNNIVVQL